MPSKSPLLFLLLAACSADVRVVGDDRHPSGSDSTSVGAGSASGGGATIDGPGGGGGPSDGGGIAAGGTGGGSSDGGGIAAGGTGGDGGTAQGGGGTAQGGGEAVPFPGCETLEADGEPFVIEGAGQGYLVAINSSEMAFVGSYSGGGDVETRSRRISVDAWPPALSAELVHADLAPTGVGTPNLPMMKVREDGAFALALGAGWYKWHVGSFFQPGLIASDPDDLQRYPILEPTPGGGVYWPHGQGLDYYPTLDADAPTATIHPPPGVTKVYGTSGSGALILLVSDEFVRVTSGALQLIGPKPPSGAAPHSIVPRAGGFWFGSGDPVEMIAVDEDGTVGAPSRPLGDGAVSDRVVMAPWQGGVAMAALDPWSSWFTIAVTDGTHTTTLKVYQTDSFFADDSVSLAAFPDGNSLYVSFLRYWPEVEHVIVRFSCAAG